MKEAENPSNERERLQALLSYQILDTAPELQYDELTLLASEICQTPIALVSLLDDHRQWFKSKQGLDAEETARNISFCGHAIHQTEVFIVQDSSKDERFVDNPLALGGPHVRFYAGAPIINSEGLALGTLCVIDTNPRELRPEQIKALKILANQVMGQMELRKANLALSANLKEVQQITEKLFMNEGFLIQHSKFTTAGEMAGGIIHDINNPLTIIEGTVRRLQKFAREQQLTPEKVTEPLEKILAQSGKIGKIVQTLRTFTRGSDGDPFKPVKLTVLLDSVVMLASQKHENCKNALEIKNVPDLSIECRDAQIQQVLLNLVSNSFDAIEGLSEKWVRIEIKATESKIEIAVTDSGKGIAPEFLSKLTLPFNTTKPSGKGLGLDLYISKNIMESHHGTLRYNDTSPNTCFIVELPIKQESSS